MSGECFVTFVFVSRDCLELLQAYARVAANSNVGC